MTDLKFSELGLSAVLIDALTSKCCNWDGIGGNRLC